MGEQETNTVPVETALSKGRKVLKTIDLPSGKKAVIYEGKGLDSINALKDADQESSKYLVCLMARLIEINGAQVVQEDLEELPLSDFMKLQTEFATENF